VRLFPLFFIFCFLCETANAEKLNQDCISGVTSSSPTVTGKVVNENSIPIVGVFAEVSFPGNNPITVKTDNGGCFTASINVGNTEVPLSVDIKRKEDSAVLVRVVDRCSFNDSNICDFSSVKIYSPNTVYLLPFDGEEENQVFMSRQFRSALSTHFINNLQELEGEKVVRRLKVNSKRNKFVKLKPPGLKVYKESNSRRFEVSDFEKLEKLGGDLNALALISGTTSLDEQDNMLDMSSFYLVPDEATWSLDDRLDANKLKNMIMLSRKLSPQWTYYTMMAIAKREFTEANASPDKIQNLKRIKAYLQAQRNQLDSRAAFKQNELMDLLCEIRQALGERCGELLLSMD